MNRSVIFAPALLAMLTLSGCITSTAKVRERETAGVFHSSMTPSATAKCIVENMAVMGSGSVYSDNGVTTVTIATNGSTLLLFDIATDSTITVKKLASYLPYKKRLSRCL